MIAKYALSAAALLQLASKANGQVVAGDGADGISGEDWATVASEANFTQHVGFEGYNVEESYPSSTQGDWSLHYSVKDLGSGDELLTAGTISIYGPDDQVTFDDSWLLCVHVFEVKDTSAGGFGSATNGCDDVVADECVDDLQKNAIKNFGAGCPSFKTTESCMRDIGDGTRSSVVAINSTNADRLVGSDTSFWRYAFGTHPADEADDATLLAAAGTPQAVITVFGSGSDAEAESFGSATCVLPDTAENGTVDPTEGAASGFAAFAGWAALTGAAVAYQLL